MFPVQFAAISFLKILVGLDGGQPVERKHDSLRLFALAIDRLQCRIGRHSISITILRLLENTHNLKGKSTHLEMLTHQ